MVCVEVARPGAWLTGLDIGDSVQIVAQTTYHIGDAPRFHLAIARADADPPCERGDAVTFDLSDVIKDAVDNASALNACDRADVRALAEWLRYMARCIEIDLEEQTRRDERHAP